MSHTFTVGSINTPLAPGSSIVRWRRATDISPGCEWQSAVDFPSFSSGGDPISNAIQAEQQGESANDSVNSPTKVFKAVADRGSNSRGRPSRVGPWQGTLRGGYAQPGTYAQTCTTNAASVFQRQGAQETGAILARQQANDIAQQRADTEGWGQPVAGQDSNGNPAFFVRNRRTGETKQVNGITPPDKSGAGRSVMTDQG